MFFNSWYIFILGYKLSILLVLGFAFLILFFFIYINSSQEKERMGNLHIHFLSENFFKIFLLLLIIIFVFIPSDITQKSIILWELISPLNYIKSIIIILSIAFLPGSNIYSILFLKDEISKRIKIEPFFLKITLYPLISFGFIGTLVLILDQIGLIRKYIEIVLVIIIFLLCFFDFYLQKSRNNLCKPTKIRLQISRNTFFILLFAFTVGTISIGFQLGWKYLISGDPWDSIRYANHIGITGTSPLYIDSYPNFWGYVSFGFSVLTGIPFININTLLAPFSYLFVTSIYFLMKSLLSNFKEHYAVLATILLLIFSGLYIDNPVFSLVMGSEFYFIYKSYSYCLFFMSLTLFFMIITGKFGNSNEIRRIYKIKEFKLIFLGAFLLILSFMTYMFPLLLGMLYLFLFCIFSEKNKRQVFFKFYLYFTLIVILLYIFFDLILQFYLSYIIVYRFLRFFDYGPLVVINDAVPPPILIYTILIILFLILYLLKFSNLQIFKNHENLTKKKNNKFKLIGLFVSIMFILFTILEFFIIILEIFILNINLSNMNFFFLYLDYFFLNIGFIGLIGLSFSYYSFQKNKNLTLALFSWIIFSFLLAFLLFFIENIINFPLSPEKLPETNFFMMDYWFDRIWIYSIPALCILASINLTKLFKKFRNSRFIIKYKYLQVIPKNVISLSLILFSFSGIIITGILNGSTRFRYSNSAITTLNWISENIPIHSGILVGDNFFMGVGTDSITFVRQYFFYDIFEEDFNETQCIEKIEFLKNESIQYAVISQFFISHYLNKSNFTNYYLLPKFYNISLYVKWDLSVYYAPYFN